MKSNRLSLQTLFSEGFRKIGPGTALALLFLLIAMSSVAYGITQVVRGLSPGFAFSLAVLGLLAGWLLARSRLSIGQAGIISSLMGLAVLVVHLARLGVTLYILLLRANGLVLAFFQGPPGSTTLLESLQRLGFPLQELGEKLGVLLERMAAYLASLLSGSPAFDPLASLILWGSALWAAAVWASWQVRRAERPLAALLPGGLLLSGSLSYSAADPSILIPFLAAALLLILLVEHQSLRRGWEVTHTDYSEELGLDIALLAVPLAAMILATAAFSPNLSPRRISQLVQEALPKPYTQIRELGDSLGLRPAPARDSKLDSQRSPGMPRRHLLGSGPELSSEIVMEVRSLEIGGPQQGMELSPGETARLNYWRWLTYDIYTGSGWTTSRYEPVSYRAGEPARPAGWANDARITTAKPDQLSLTQEIEFLGPSQGALYAVGTVLATDTDYQLAWRPSSEQIGVDIFGGSVESSHYRVHSLVSIPRESQLRISGNIYPQELRDRYLVLPDALPQRVHTLALELTATLSTPYERARAIESYLRSIPYSLDIPRPPGDTDAIDYYLFELKSGYCDYAASAMVVLARAAGIPARLVTGYAGGHYDPNRALMVVTEADAHSWAELYFPGSGWVEFEPTSGRPGIEYIPYGEPATQTSVEAQPFPTEEKPQDAWFAWLILGALPALLALSMVGWQFADQRRLGKMVPERTVKVLYERFYRNVILLTAGSTLTHTPNELAARFTAWMAVLEASTRWDKRLTIHPSQVHRLIELYNLTVYSPYPPGRLDQDLAIQAWGHMRWRLWLLRLFPWQFSGKRGS